VGPRLVGSRLVGSGFAPPRTHGRRHNYRPDRCSTARGPHRSWRHGAQACQPPWRSACLRPGGGLASRSVRRRRDVAGGVDAADATGWRSTAHPALGSAASHPHGPPDDARDTPTPGSQGWWGRRPASATDDGPPTRPAAAGSQGPQPPSRTARAVRWVGVTTRVVRPRSNGWLGAPPRIGGSGAAAVRSRAASPRSPWPSRWWSPGRPPGPPGRGRRGWGSGGRSSRPGRRRGRRGRRRGGGWGLAGDQHQGHHPITGQPPTGLGRQRSGPTNLAADRPGMAQQALQVDGDRQLRADSTGPGQPASLQARRANS
jgi:hypothetical protein